MGDGRDVGPARLRRPLLHGAAAERRAGTSAGPRPRQRLGKHLAHHLRQIRQGNGRRAGLRHQNHGARLRHLPSQLRSRAEHHRHRPVVHHRRGRPATQRNHRASDGRRTRRSEPQSQIAHPHLARRRRLRKRRRRLRRFHQPAVQQHVTTRFLGHSLRGNHAGREDRAVRDAGFTANSGQRRRLRRRRYHTRRRKHQRPGRFRRLRPGGARGPLPAPRHHRHRPRARHHRPGLCRIHARENADGRRRMAHQPRQGNPRLVGARRLDDLHRCDRASYRSARETGAHRRHAARAGVRGRHAPRRRPSLSPSTAASTTTASASTASAPSSKCSRRSRSSTAASR